MFTINAVQLIGIILASAFVGSMLGFFAAAMLGVSGRCSEDELSRPWPGEQE